MGGRFAFEQYESRLFPPSQVVRFSMEIFLESREENSVGGGKQFVVVVFAAVAAIAAALCAMALESSSHCSHTMRHDNARLMLVVELDTNK